MNSLNKPEEKKYSHQDPSSYKNSHFHDYFRAIPFIKLKKLLKRNRAGLDDQTVLIAGCQCGIDAYYLKKLYHPRKVCFTDVSMPEMEKTKSNFSKEWFALSDNCLMSFKDNSFDYVFIARSLHHLKEPAKGLYELLRIAKKGLIAIEPNDTFLTRIFKKLGWASEYEMQHKNYVYRFSKSDVGKIAKALFFKYDLMPCFTVHKVAQTNFGFLILKLLNGLANSICPQQGNYITFLIEKKQALPKCLSEK